MIQFENRFTGCLFCGKRHRAASRDHNPSRVLLDAPMPSALPTVPACRDCNSQFASDELDFAVLIDCARVGSAEPNDAHRPKVHERLRNDGRVARRATSALAGRSPAGALEAEADLVAAMLRMLSRGHVGYELQLAKREMPAELRWDLLPELDGAAEKLFEATPATVVAPRAGTRAYSRTRPGERGEPWVVVQAGRYRYRVDSRRGVVVSMVLSEWLAGFVRW